MPSVLEIVKCIDYYSYSRYYAILLSGPLFSIRLNHKEEFDEKFKGFSGLLKLTRSLTTTLSLRNRIFEFLCNVLFRHVISLGNTKGNGFRGNKYSEIDVCKQLSKQIYEKVLLKKLQIFLKQYHFAPINCREHRESTQREDMPTLSLDLTVIVYKDPRVVNNELAVINFNL